MSDEPKLPPEAAQAASSANISAIGGGGIEVKIGDMDLIMSPPTAQNIIDFREYWQSRILKLVRSSISGDSPRDRASIIAATAGRVMTEADFQEALDTTEGQLHLFWLLCRKNHPKLTKDQFMIEVDKNFATALEDAQASLAAVAPPQADKSDPSEQQPTGDTSSAK